VEQHELEIFADYFQVYIADESAYDDLYTSIDWTAQALQDRYIAGESFCAIATARNMTVPVILAIETEPTERVTETALFENADHVIEGAIKFSSGQLVMWGPGEYLKDSFRLKLEPGNYYISIYFNNLDSLREKGLEGDDLYQIVLYPASESTAYRVTKRFE
jgi:hypothetical protein